MKIPFIDTLDVLEGSTASIITIDVYQTTWCYIAEDSRLHARCHEGFSCHQKEFYRRKQASLADKKCVRRGRAIAVRCKVGRRNRTNSKPLDGPIMCRLYRKQERVTCNEKQTNEHMHLFLKERNLNLADYRW